MTDRYSIARSLGSSHAWSVFWQARGIVNEEIETARTELETEELHTVLANAREDVSGMAMLAVDAVNRQRRMDGWLIAAVLLLGIIAYRL